MIAQDIAASLAQAFGSGKAGALSIGGGATAVTANIQTKLDSEFSQIGALLGKYGGTSFTDAIATGAQGSAAKTQANLAGKAVNSLSITPTMLYLGIAAIVAAGLYLWGRRA